MTRRQCQALYDLVGCHSLSDILTFPDVLHLVTSSRQLSNSYEDLTHTNQSQSGSGGSSRHYSVPADSLPRDWDLHLLPCLITSQCDHTRCAGIV